MNIFFDVDYPIFRLEDSLRPGTLETLQKIKDDGREIYIWSGMGESWEVVKKHNLASLISRVYEKPTHHFQERLEELGVPLEPDFVIDDYPEIVAAFSGVWVPPYFFKRTVDQEMDRLYQIVCDVVESGSSEDRQYKAKGPIIPLF